MPVYVDYFSRRIYNSFRNNCFTIVAQGGKPRRAGLPNFKIRQGFVMIENLQGIHETVNYKKDTRLRLYVNDECEHYPPHWHPALEILCPLQGGYAAICNNRTFPLRTGDILIICPGAIHDLPEQADGARIIFQADCSVLYSIKEIETVLSLMAPARCLTPESLPDAYPRVYELLLEIRDLYLGNRPLSEAQIYARLLEIIALVGCSHTGAQDRFDVKTAKRQEYNEKLLSICNYIAEHCAEELTLEQVAQQAGFSKFYFDRLFKQFTDVSFYKYLTQKRIACAERLLMSPDISITEAAYRAGFSSATAFIRTFKSVKQCTPSQFRQMHT